jgi:hypothetical protein
MLTPTVGLSRASGPSPLLIRCFAGGQSRSITCRPSLLTYHSRTASRFPKVISNAYEARSPQDQASAVATPHSGYHFDGTPRRCKKDEF